jgi:hypothetical protein
MTKYVQKRPDSSQFQFVLRVSQDLLHRYLTIFNIPAEDQFLSLNCAEMSMSPRKTFVSSRSALTTGTLAEQTLPLRPETRFPKYISACPILPSTLRLLLPTMRSLVFVSPEVASTPIRFR